MQFLAITLLAGAAAASMQERGDVEYTTVVVTSIETYCPEPTIFSYEDKTYTVTEATTLTITDCPNNACTIKKPIYTASSVYCGDDDEASCMPGHGSGTGMPPPPPSGTAWGSGMPPHPSGTPSGSGMPPPPPSGSGMPPPSGSGMPPPPPSGTAWGSGMPPPPSGTAWGSGMPPPPSGTAYASGSAPPPPPPSGTGNGTAPYPAGTGSAYSPQSSTGCDGDDCTDTDSTTDSDDDGLVETSNAGRIAVFSGAALGGLLALAFAL